MALVTVACATGRSEIATPVSWVASSVGHQVTVDGSTVSWRARGPAGAPVVLLVHGSPGSGHNFDDLTADPALETMRVLTIDRPGFGASPGPVDPTLEGQVRALLAVLDAAGVERAVAVGHSLGGSIVARLALDAPHRVVGLVLVAAPLDPAHERLRWYNKVADWRWVRALLPTALRRSNDEMLPLRSELEAMVPLWPGLAVPTVVVHGERDRLVPVDHAGFPAHLAPAAPVETQRVAGLGHLVPWKRPDLIRDAILRLIRDLE